jgi:general secretion pathway protein G
MRKRGAFTLVEILIVVVLLGVLAAIVIPMAGDSTTLAKGSAVAHDLQMLRRCILIYKSQHLEVAPGYPNGATDQAPTEQAFVNQITMSSNINGQTAPRGTPGFDYGPYLLRMPGNPFNNKSTVQMLGDGEEFPANADGSDGWIYKAGAAEVRADNIGADQSGKLYYDY